MPLNLYNSLTRKVEPFAPADPSRVTFYSCGPTVYDDAHIGNFRSFLAADVLRRWIESPLCTLLDQAGKEHTGPRTVVHVMNITDVGHMTDDAEGGESGEDRMAVAGRRLAEAKKSGKLPAGTEINPNDPYQIARFYEERFREDAKRLGLKIAIEAEDNPAQMPRATENIAGMIEVVKRLIDTKHAYVVGTPGNRVVYFRVQSYEPYGTLSGNTLDKLREGAGGRLSGENQSTKEHPADFLLWKEDPSHIMKWESPWGWGYPGWHIECTVMSVLGTSARRGSDPAAVANLKSLVVPNGNALIDLHSGGEDNIFPHHECEMAQSCCAFNQSPNDGRFSTLWFHPRFLLVEGTKMSKSKGNFYTARDLFAKGIEPAAIRLELIKSHYRMNADFTMEGLAASQKRLDRWRRFAKWRGTPQGASVAMSYLASAYESTIRNLNNDLNMGGLIGALDAAVGHFENVHINITKRLVTDADLAQTSFPESPKTPADCLAPIQDRLESERAGVQFIPDAGFDLALLHVIDNILGVIFQPLPKNTTTDIGLYLSGLAPDPAIEAKLAQRRAARAAKDFATSDKIRDELAAMGLAIKDVAGGKVEVSRK